MRRGRHKQRMGLGMRGVGEQGPCLKVCTVDRSMKSASPLGMRQLILPYSLPGSGTPK